MKQVSQKRENMRLVINKNGSPISEPTHVAKLFNTYFTETAERLQSYFTPGVLKYSNNKQNFQPQYFLHPQIMRK
jgi:hypothetical protein